MSRARAQCCSFLGCLPTKQDKYSGVLPVEGEDIAQAETGDDVVIG